jgi:predicted nucleotidyltransferase
MAKPSSNDTTILTGVIGSHSYGTATPASDFDYMSVVIASPDVYLGLDNWGTAGTKDDVYEDAVKGLVEHRYFELKKFMGMCEGMNPNAIVTLWLEQQHYEVLTPAGQLLVRNREIFNSKKVYNTFSGYAHGQLQKMGGVFNDAEEPNKLLKAGHQKFQEWADFQIKLQREMRDGKYNGPELNTQNYDEGYLNSLIELRTFSKEQCKRIKDGPITGRMGAKRKELRAQYGYDTKFAFHTIRLMKMCVEFLRNPEEGLKVYRKNIDADFLYSIRVGAYTQEEVKKMADDLFAEAKEALKTTSLPEEPDREGIHNLTCDLIRSTLV